MEEIRRERKEERESEKRRFILESTVYLWAVVYAYHIILGSTVYLREVVFIYHFIM